MIKLNEIKDKEIGYYRLINFIAKDDINTYEILLTNSKEKIYRYFLSNIFKSIRHLEKKTQRELAQILNKSEITIRKYEANDSKINIGIMVELLNKFDIDKPNFIVICNETAELVEISDYFENTKNDLYNELLKFDYFKCFNSTENDYLPRELMILSDYIEGELQPIFMIDSLVDKIFIGNISDNKKLDKLFIENFYNKIENEYLKMNKDKKLEFLRKIFEYSKFLFSQNK